MTDMHTHILPGMDDGAKDVNVSLQMLRTEKVQGVDTVILTPHFYRERENSETFLARRQEAFFRLQEAVERLSPQEQAMLPGWELGAEVAWMPNLAQREELPYLCLGKSRYFLLELPVTPWNDLLLRQLYDLMTRGDCTPVIAHLERYWGRQKPEYIREILRLGLPIQLSASTLLKPFARRRALHMIEQGHIHLIASDCHNLHSRAPNLGAAMEIVTRRLGQRQTRRLCRWAEEVCHDI